MKRLNKEIVDLVPDSALANDPIREVVKTLYDNGTSGGSNSQIFNSPVDGWKETAAAPNHFTGQENFYNRVLANACRTCHIAQPLFVGNLLRELEREDKTFRRTINPAADRGRGGRCVESRIDFDRVERARVNRQKIGRSRARRIERSDPGIVIPALSADVNLRRHGVQSEAAASGCQGGGEFLTALAGSSSKARGSRLATA